MKVAHFPRVSPWVFHIHVGYPIFLGLLEVQVRNQSRKGDCKRWRPGSLRTEVVKPSSTFSQFDPMFRGWFNEFPRKKLGDFQGRTIDLRQGIMCVFFWTSDKIIEVNGELSHCHVWWHWRGKKLWYTWRIRPGISDCLWLVYKWDKPRNGYVLTRVLHHMHIQFEKATRRSSPAEWVLLSYA